MSYRKRKILNRAASDANREEDSVRDDFVNQIEQLRELVDITPKEINEALDKPENWYSNNTRGDKSGHDFTLRSYSEVRVFLQMASLYMYEADELDKEEIKRMVDIGAIEGEMVDLGNEVEP